MLESIPAQTRTVLDKYHFDRIPFEAMRNKIAATADLDSLHIIREPIAPGSPDAVHRTPEVGSDEYRALERDGAAAIARGELGAVILAGGMATRFGSMVKALAPLFEGKSVTFLDAKLADLARRGDGRIDTSIMTSFATDEAIGRVVSPTVAHRAPQFVSMRLTAKGELFHDPQGALSLYATGHGDLPEALSLSGSLHRLRTHGVRTLLVSNVDNLGATADPVLFALHRRLGAPITVELVQKHKGDKGGIPVKRGNDLVLAEAFRLPKDFPQDQFPLFNTNTLWIDLDALVGEFPWTWCIAKKKVDGLDAVQIERLVGELTWWRQSQYIQVPRDGVQTRFIPIKEVDDLKHARETIESVLRERIGLSV